MSIRYRIFKFFWLRRNKNWLECRKKRRALEKDWQKYCERKKKR